MACHTGEYAKRLGGDARDCVDEYTRRWFDVAVAHGSRAKHEWKIDGHEGGMLSVGIGGRLTGSGADVLIIDDPVKDAEDAYSPRYQERNWDWAQSVATTRLAPGGSIVVVQTRWHANDLSGKFLQAAKDNPDALQWEVVSFPAIAEDHDILGRKPGEALWPARFPIEELNRIKAGISPIWWQALYQQAPTNAEGELFKQSWFRTWKEEGYGGILLEGGKTFRMADVKRFGTCDLAWSEHNRADFTVIQCWGLTPDRELLLMDIHRERMTPQTTIQALKRFQDQHQTAEIVVEKAFAQSLVTAGAIKAGVRVKPALPRGDKVERSASLSSLYQQGRVFHRFGAHWLGAYTGELLAFPMGANDDQVDAAAYAGIYCGAGPQTRLSPPKAVPYHKYRRHVTPRRGECENLNARNGILALR